MFQIRKKTSAQDLRPVPTAVGYVAIVFLVIVLGLIVVMDIPTFIRQFRELCAHISSYYNG